MSQSMLDADAVNVTIPELSLVLLVGASGSGKSTFARKHFKPTEVLSSDYFRGAVADDENDQAASADAFDVLNYVLGKRLAAGRLAVVDATNVTPEARKPLVEIGRRYHVLPVAIVFDLPEALCHERNRLRPDRNFGPHVVRRQRQNLRRSMRGLRAEGFRTLHVLSSPEEVEAATIVREPLWCNARHEHGPFDVIGDIHGCFDELIGLIEKLGYVLDDGAGRHAPPIEPTQDGDGSGLTRCQIRHPDGRRLLFLGDLVDRGPKIPEVLRLVMDAVDSGVARCVMGNHEAKLLRKLQGRNVQITHGLRQTLDQLGREAPEFTERVRSFVDALISHYVLDDGKLVIAHAGLREEMHGRASGAVQAFALYGETTGETDEWGLPVRGQWGADYRGKATVVYGHTPVADPEWLNRTINIDCGCVFGGRLTALRYPEQELVSVAAARVYYEPARPLAPPAEPAPLTAQQHHDDLLDIDDVLGKRSISTTLLLHVAIREENAIAALEAMSRFAVNPKWLIYLPPTMSPPETTRLPGLLEHPAEAFSYFAGQGIQRVVCEEKHMGSRAVVVVCRDEDAARRRFGVIGEGSGIVYTRTGRRFFDDDSLEGDLLSRVRAALDSTDAWGRFETDWLCLDCELLPWSAKAQGLLRGQYAAVGAAGRAALGEAVSLLERASATGADASELLDRYRARAEMVGGYVDAYRRYCWEVESIDDLRLAPFHLLAGEGRVYADRDHNWHMEMLAAICRAGEPLLLPTPYRVVDLVDPASQASAIAWWEELTGRGGEGMVVKPFDFIARGPRGLVQPAVKCRGREYLRIIYGPEYTAPEHLERLRSRSLGAKRGLALREFALGIEALERFVRREPLRRVHECVFGVLALESEPVDPRL